MTTMLSNNKNKNPVDDKIKADLNAMDELYNVSLSGKSSAFKSFNLNDKPLGSRYFMKADEDEYVLIDNMKYHKNSKGQLDMSKYGLLYGAGENLKELDASNNSVTCIEEGGGEKCLEKFQNKTIEGNTGTTTVEVEVLTDPTKPESTEKKNVSFASYQKMQCTAFPGKNGKENCKRYTAMFPEHCDSCDIVEADPLATPTSEEINDLAAEQLASNEDYQAGLDNIKNLEEQLDDMETFISGNNYESFYSRYSQPLNNFRKEEPKEEYVYKIESSPQEKHIVMEDDVITVTYIAGVTILGLCVFGLLFSKSSKF